MRAMSQPRRWGVISIAAAMLVVAPGLAACSSSKDVASSDVLAEVVKRGTVRIGECMGNPPYASFDQNNKPEGYDIDIANKLGTALGVKVEIVDTAAAARIPSLQTDKVDVVLCNTTRTLERVQQVWFTNTYAVSGSILLSRKGSGIASLADLKGKKVAVTKGTPFGDLVKQKVPTASTIDFDSSAEGVTAVKQGQADAIIEDSGFLQYQAKLDPSLEVSTDSVTPLYYNSFAVKKGQSNWLAWLNEFLFELNAGGQNAELYAKWFGTPPAFKLNPSY